MLVDGAIFSNLPVEPMLATSEGPVIAVDVSGRLPPPRAPRSNLQFLRRWIAGPAADWAPSITETVLRSILLGNAASDAAARERADVVIQPNLRGVPTMRFRDVERIRGLGRDAVREAAASGALEVLKDSGGDTNGAIRRERTARGVAT
jgi:predicted acylesterase/phospholipase RssA